MEITEVKLKIGKCQFNRQIFPEKYTPENKMGLYSQEEKQAAKAGAFNRSSNIWLDFSPYAGDVKLEKDDVIALGLAFKPKWYLKFFPENSKTPLEGSVIGTGVGVAETAIENVWNIGGESADESLGYHIRQHCVGEGVYNFVVELEVGGKTFMDSVSFKVS